MQTVGHAVGRGRRAGAFNGLRQGPFYRKIRQRDRFLLGKKQLIAKNAASDQYDRAGAEQDQLFRRQLLFPEKFGLLLFGRRGITSFWSCLRLSQLVFDTG